MAEIEKVDAQNLAVKVLGLKWLIKNDSFVIKIKQKPGEIFTKREATGIIAGLYDPCGFLGPVTLAAKSILQDMWKYQASSPENDPKAAWDEELPPALNEKFLKWSKNLHVLSLFEIPRHLGCSIGVEMKILTFVDASNVGYGAVCYLWVKVNNSVSVTLIQSKNYVAAINRNFYPKKKPELSISRLEMLAAVTGAKLCEKLRNALELPPSLCHLFFSDSMVVLGQVYNPDVQRTAWVERRLRKIRAVSDAKQWYHIAGEENICADSLSRGLMPEQLMEIKDSWIHGPEFVRQLEIPLPEQNISSELEKATRQPSVEIQFKIATPQPESSNYILDKLSECKTFSRAKKLLVRICKAFKGTKVSQNNEDKFHPISKKISAKDMRQAEIMYITMVQKEFFSDLLTQIKSNKEPGVFRGRNPFIDKKGLIRLATRLQKCNDYEYANPILLPPVSQKLMSDMEKEGKFPILRQLINEGHMITVHGGPAEVQSYINRRFWTLNLRNTVRMIIHRCLRCAKARPAPVVQMMGDLPAERITDVSSPFSSIVIDYGGPFDITTGKRVTRQTADADKSLKNKVFVMMIVCQATNACYIDVVADSSANSFLDAFTRFTNTRGPVKSIRTDNATCFVRAAKILEASNGKQAVALGLAKIEGFTADWHVEWQFNPPRTPHFGGHAEVFIKMMKSKLKRAMAHKLPIMSLLTVLKKIEGALNSRPLISISSKFDGDHYLTPAHFIMLKPAVGMPELGPDKPTPCIKRRYETQCLMIKAMWKIHKPYLQMLANRAKWYKVTANLKVKDLVLLVEDNEKNSLAWKTGIIVKTYPGKDGLVRVVDVKTANGVLKRGVLKLSKLPVDLDP